MNVKTFLTSAAATAALVGTIGFAYAQTESTTRNPDGTVRDMTQPSGTTGNRATTPSPSTSGTMNNSTGTTTDNSRGTTNSTGSTTDSSRGVTNNSAMTTDNSRGTTNSTDSMSNNRNSTRTERAARADRN